MSVKWQPIETAPKDGTHILVCDDCRNHPPAYSTHVANVAWWGDDDEWVVYCSMVREPSLFFQPTHWMPLPAPPENAR